MRGIKRGVPGATGIYNPVVTTLTGEEGGELVELG